MEPTYWHKQEPDKPLFPDLLWSRPENKLHAGKLLIIGGNLYGFSAPAEAYAAALKAGIGTARVLLPECLRKTVGHHLAAAEFGACTPSGSFSRQALGEWLEQAAWADGVLLAGDLGRNSETAILIEQFLQKYPGQVTLTKDAVDYITARPELVVARPATTLVLSLGQLQKLAKSTRTTKAITFDMGLLQIVDWLHEFTSTRSVHVITQHLDTIFVAVAGSISTASQPTTAQQVWRVPLAAKASVWWLQHAQRSFEALTTSVNPIDNN